MRQPLNKILQTITQVDIESLYSIYQYRCLDNNQLYQLFKLNSNMFQDNEEMGRKYLTKRIKQLLKMELIKETSYRPDKSVYFLTAAGVEVLRHLYSFPANIYDANKKASSRGYYRASELEIFPKNINHQVYLNQFVIDYLSEKNPTPVRYFDEKYASQYTSIRPDGIFSFADADVFLEMDMSTESKKQLYEKWESYREFLNSAEYAYREKRIVVLFIVAGTLQLEKRIDLIRYTIYESLLDMHDGEFEIVVGTHDMLLDYLTTYLVPSFTNQVAYKSRIIHTLKQNHHFIWSNGERLDKLFDKASFGGYIRKINSEQKIMVEDGRIQEFLIDDYYFSPTDVIAKIAYIEKHNSYFYQRFKRNFSYLVICENERAMFNNLKMLDLQGTKNVFFTTEKRLREKPFYEALFQFDMLGNLFCFKNMGLRERVFEATFHDAF